MEKGSFHRPNVPIPSAVPPKVDLSALPSNVVRSGAVEALLNQNEDLMARLSVSLRRISTLEDKLSHASQANEKVKFQYENLKDQVFILKEKAKAITLRKSNSEKEFLSLKEQVKMADIRYTELYKVSQEKEQQLNHRANMLAKRLSRFINYRAKVQVASKKIRTDLQNENQRIQEELSSEIQNLTESLKQAHSITNQLENKLQVTERTLSEVRERLTESTDYIQKQSKTFIQEKENLSQSYENKIKSIITEKDLSEEKIKESFSCKIEELDSKIGQLETDNKNLTEKNSEMDKVYEDNIQLRNKIVFTERKRDEIKTNLEDQIESLQKNLAHYRGDARSKTIEVDKLQTNNKELNQEIKEVQLANNHMAEQVENLQALWRETQNRLEEQTEKNKALQKLNQQLSTNINLNRNEIKELKAQLDHATLLANKKMRQIKKNAETAMQIKGIHDNGDPEFHPQLMNRIDSLIAEIQSGFSRKE